MTLLCVKLTKPNQNTSYTTEFGLLDTSITLDNTLFFLYICVCVDIHIFKYACVHTHIYSYRQRLVLFLCVYIFISRLHDYAHLYMCTCGWTCMYICICIHVDVGEPVCTSAYIHVKTDVINQAVSTLSFWGRSLPSQPVRPRLVRDPVQWAPGICLSLSLQQWD